MDKKSVVKVGFVVLVGLILLAVFALQLKHYRLNTYKVVVKFDNSLGLPRQSVVRMSGVAIGEVASVQLDQTVMPPRPVVTLAIDRQYQIPKNSKFVIVSGLLITNPQLEVQPDLQTASGGFLPQDNSAVGRSGISAGALETISPDLNKTVKTLSNTVANANEKLNAANEKLNATSARLNTLLDNTNQLVLQSNKTILAVNKVATDPRLQKDLFATVENFRDISVATKKTTVQLSEDLHTLVASGKGKFDRIYDTAIELATKLGGTVDQANNIVKKLTEQVSDPRLQQSLQETVELARATLSSVRQITSDLHQLTGDPTLKANFTQSVENLKDLTESGKKAADRLDKLLGKVSDGTGKVSTPRLPKIELIANASEQINPGHFRLDADARLHLNSQNLLDIGLYDIGDNTRFNLQAGRQFNDRLLARYGLYASKLGVGLEYEAARGAGLRFDLYDANHPRLDVRGLIRVNKNASLWVGGENIFRNPVPAFGIQIKQ